MSIVPFINRPAPFPLPFTPGPDGRAPVQESMWAQGRGWCQGRLFASPLAYLAAASGTFSRGSDGTRFDAFGIMQVDGPNVPRLDHDPATGESLGLRAEGSRTNLLTNSKLSGAVSGTPGTPPTNWTSGNPSGTLSTIDLGQYLRLQVTVTASRFSFSQNGVPVAANKTYFCSVHVEIISGAIGINNLLDVRFLPTGATFSYILDGAPVANPNTPLTLGRHLIGCLVTIASTAGTVNIGFGAGVSNAATASLIFDLPQLEEGTFRSLSIPTTTTAVTRLADSLSYAITGTPEGTIVVSARTPSGADGNQTLWCWDDGTADNRYRLVRDSSRHLRFVVTVSGTDVVNLDLGTVADDTAFKVAAGWKSGLFAASLNGAAAVTDSSYAGSLPSVTTMREGAASNGSEWFGTIKRMRRYSTAYSAAQLPGMSS